MFLFWTLKERSAVFIASEFIHSELIVFWKTQGWNFSSFVIFYFSSFIFVMQNLIWKVYLKKYVFIYLFFGCGGSSSLTQAFSSCSEQGLLLSWCAGFSLQWLLLLGNTSSRAWPQSLVHGLSCIWGMWSLPRPGIESVFLVLQGKFFTSGWPGKLERCIFLYLNVIKNKNIYKEKSFCVPYKCNSLSQSQSVFSVGCVSLLCVHIQICINACVCTCINFFLKVTLYFELIYEL